MIWRRARTHWQRPQRTPGGQDEVFVRGRERWTSVGCGKHNRDS